MQIESTSNHVVNDGQSGAANWIENLVNNEKDLIQNRTGDLLGHQDKKRVVEHATSDFLRELKTEFIACVDTFNAYRGGSHLPNSVKIFNVSKTESDFIIFRNTLKLVVSNPSMGIVNFSIIFRDLNFMASQNAEKREGYDVIAQVLPFNEVVWTYRGENVSMSSIVRFLFTEFVKISAQY